MSDDLTPTKYIIDHLRWCIESARQQNDHQSVAAYLIELAKYVF